MAGLKPKPDLAPAFILLLAFILIVLGGINGNQEPEDPKDEQPRGGGCVQASPAMNEDELKKNEFTVSVGNFKSEKEAYWLIGRLRASNINNFVMKYQGRWHVCVGKKFSKKRADRMFKMLQDYGFNENAQMQILPLPQPEQLKEL
jgi:hypothetical protein